MEALKVFENPEFGKVRTMEIDGKPYFAGTDIAKILGYSNPWDAIKRHCKSDGVVKREGVTITVNQYGAKTEQVVEMLFINEPNVYRMTTHSKLETAEKFESWVFDEVLPSIRKTGGYRDSTADAAKMALEITKEVLKTAIPEIVRAVLLVNAGELLNTAKSKNNNGGFEQIGMHIGCIEGVTKIERFPKEFRNIVDDIFIEMINTDMVNYSSVARFCIANGYPVSNPSVKRYFVKRFCSE